MASPNQKVIFFDLMGTCCDWLSSIRGPLSDALARPTLAPKGIRTNEFALAWREGFFEEIHARFERGDAPEDIDITHRRVLDRLCDKHGIGCDVWSDTTRSTLVRQWHVQQPWPDVIDALRMLRHTREWFLVVLANGTTRLQLDIAQTSDIPFHMLMSSELLGITKPDPAMYRKAMELVRLPPERSYMLASHLYDLKAAKSVGMNSIYIHRTTEDVGIDIDLEGEHEYVDLYFDGRYDGLASGANKNDGAKGFSAAVAYLVKHHTLGKEAPTPT